MIQLTKASRPSPGKDTLVIITDPAQLRDVELERPDRQYLAEQHVDFALALFDGGDNVPSDTPVLIEGLHLTHKSAGDEIYSAAP